MQNVFHKKSVFPLKSHAFISNIYSLTYSQGRLKIQQVLKGTINFSSRSNKYKFLAPLNQVQDNTQTSLFTVVEQQVGNTNANVSMIDITNYATNHYAAYESSAILA